MNTEGLNENDLLSNLPAGKYKTLDMIEIVSALTKNNPLLLDFLEKDLDEHEKGVKYEYERCRQAIRYLRENGNHKTRLDQPQIALIYIYQQKIITRENAMEIAQSFGHNSGDRLYNCYTKLNSKQNRTGGASEKIKFKNKIELIESVTPFLSQDKKALEWALAEIHEMKDKEEAHE